jgi:hypothetical protein
VWYSMVVQYRGQSMQEACLHAEQFLCAYDSDLYGKREAKKLARQAGRDYIFRGANVGQPRLVKTPMDPRLATASEEAIRSRDQRLGFYFVMPATPAEMMTDPPRFAWDRDVLSEGEARRKAEQELAELQANQPSSRLTVQGADFLAPFYRPVAGADGVYELDPEAWEPLRRRNLEQLEQLDPSELAQLNLPVDPGGG